MNGFNLFVYGTLRGGAAAGELLDGCELLGAGTVAGTLYDIDDRFPAVVLYGEAPVRGEVWRCPAHLLLRLDAYEGLSHGLFRRVAVEVELAGAPVPAWIYAAGPALSRKLVPAARVAGGDWLAARPG